MINLQALHYLILNSWNTSDLSLFHGRMGCVLFFTHYARSIEDTIFDDFAAELLNGIYEEIHEDLPLSLENGLCGIGWGIEYLVQHGFMQGDTDDILSDIDRKVMEYDPLRITDFSFRRGLAGITFYVIARLSTIRKKGSLPFDKQYLQRLKKALLSTDFSNDIETPSFLVDSYLHLLKGEKINRIELPDILKHPTDQLTDDFSKLGLDNGISGILLSHILNKSTPINKGEKDIIPIEEEGVFIFEEKSRASNYGIGTYIQQLVNAVQNKKRKVIVFHLRSNKTKSFFYEEVDSIYHFYIGNITEFEFSYNKNKQRELYYRSSLLLIHPYIKSYKRKIFHLNYMLEFELSQILKTYYPLSKIFLTVHYTEWSFSLLGDRNKLYEILSEPNNENNQFICQTIQDEKSLLNICDKIIAIAEHSYNDLLHIYEVPKNKLSLISHGIKDYFKALTQKEIKQLRQKYGFQENEQILLFAGRLDPVKGVDILIDVLKQLVPEYPSLRLIVVGDGAYNLLLKKGEPYWSKITFTGFINKDILYELFSIVDIGILPSLHEEFGYVALEMMMMGLPLIVGKTTGLSELVVNESTGLTVSLRENEEIRLSNLINAIKQLLEKPNLRKVLAQNGRERYLKNYHFDLFVNNMNHFYNI